ncbi:MAG: ATP-dependent Clp protease adaptor ClpS [Treponema sp.]|jgi:ATP-dependent Clp protease adaptor protein ClpS|nr:ATP-dependent Clp protease adaptor ClpS [Treponema sp.]
MSVRELNETNILLGDDQELKEPGDYVVVLLNDDYTTKDFVVDVLRMIFHKSPEEANRIMQSVHNSGRGVVGAYTWDIANTKAWQVHSVAKEHDYPLRCVVEEA